MFSSIIILEQILALMSRWDIPGVGQLPGQLDSSVLLGGPVYCISLHHHLSGTEAQAPGWPTGLSQPLGSDVLCSLALTVG